MSDSMRRVLTACQGLYPSLTSPIGKETHECVISAAHGWYTLVSRCVQMMTLPANNTFQDTFCTVRRTAIEHVAALYWVAEHGDEAVGAIDTYNLDQGKKLEAALKKAKWAYEPFEGEVPQVDQANLIHSLKNTADRIQRYGGGLGSDQELKTSNAMNMYVAYLSETFHGHPSWRSASPYVDDGGDVSLLSETHNDVQPDPVHAGVMFLLPASEAFNHCLEGAPWTDRIADLDRRAAALLEKRRRSRTSER